MIAAAPQLTTTGDYHAHPAVSRTGLKCFRESRRLYHARHVLRLPEAQMKVTRPMAIGTLAHAELLEPGTLEGKYAVIPTELLGGSAAGPNTAENTKAAKEFRKEHEAAGKLVVKAEDIADMLAMVRNAATVAQPWLSHGKAEIEQPIFWEDDSFGMECRCKPDWLIPTPEKVYVWDYKNTGDASPSAFFNRIDDQELWLQDCHYRQGVKAKYGDLPIEFYFVVVESKYPYRVGVYEITRTGAGRLIESEYDDTLRALKRCQDSNNWAEPWEGDVIPVEIRERALRSDSVTFHNPR